MPAKELAQISVSASGREVAYSSVLITRNIQSARLDPVSGSVIGDPVWVTTGSRNWANPDPSPDGQWVAFYALAGGGVHVTRADGTGLRQVTGDANDRMPRWSPDGNRIAFFSNRGALLQLWSIRPDGSELRQLTDADSNVAYPVWSPDGSRMVGSQLLSPRQSRVYVFDPAGPWRPDTLPAPDSSLSPFMANSWSPDGQRLCGTIGFGATSRGILTYEIRTHRYERLTDRGEWPIWLPDNRHILFVSGGKAFYVVDRATRQVRQVFAVTRREVIGPPQRTRDGRRVYFIRRVTEADISLMTVR